MKFYPEWSLFIERVTYTGKNASVGLCSHVVLDLMSGLEREGFDLYTDNYYSSPILYPSLYEKGINVCGTMRPNHRGLPPELVHKRKDEVRGFYDFYGQFGSIIGLFLVNNAQSRKQHTSHCQTNTSGWKSK